MLAAMKGLLVSVYRITSLGCDVNPSAFSPSFDISFKRGLKRTYGFDEKS